MSGGATRGGGDDDPHAVWSAVAAPWLTLDARAAVEVRAGRQDATPQDTCRLRAGRLAPLLACPDLTLTYAARALTLREPSTEATAPAFNSASSFLVPDVFPFPLKPDGVA